MPSQAYQLPDLLSRLPKKPSGEISAYFKEAESEFNAWAEKRLGRAIAKRVHKAEMPLLAALTYPLASPSQLKLTLSCFMLNYILEEMTDGLSSTEARRNAEFWLKTLRDDYGGYDTDNPLIVLMRKEVIPDLKSGIDPFHWEQFVVANERSVKGMLQEAINREASGSSGWVPDIRTYIETRRESIAIFPCFVLTRSFHGLFFSDNVLAHSVLHEMETAAADLIGLSNDIYSFKKEILEDGALNNIITIMKHDPKTAHVDLQGRINYAGKLCLDAVDRFEACRKKLSSFRTELGWQSVAYWDGLLDWIVGSVEWSMMTPRYSLFTDNADREGNIVRLDLTAG